MRARDLEGSSATTPGPIKGITVIDMASTFMGPYCAMLLGQLGARVIKVEPPNGDVTRHIDDVTGKGMGSIFLNGNRGKESVVIDLKTSEGFSALEELIGLADVLIHNMRPSAVERMGLNYDLVRELNPRCIYCHATGFGQEGPYRDLPAYDDVVQAASGLAWLQGGKLGQPEYVRSAVVDKTVAMAALAAILAALYEREQSGLGQSVEVPMFETMVAYNLLEQQGQWVYEDRRGPVGYARTASEGRKPYRTRDGFIGILVYTDEQWSQFFDLIGRPQLAKDPRFLTIASRTANIDELYALVESELEMRGSEEWLALLQDNGIPAMPVLTIEQLFEDPHLQAVGMFESIDHPDLGRLLQAKLPWTFSRTAPSTRPGAPLLGEHTASVLREAGIDPLL